MERVRASPGFLQEAQVCLCAVDCASALVMVVRDGSRHVWCWPGRWVWGPPGHAQANVARAREGQAGLRLPPGTCQSTCEAASWLIGLCRLPLRPGWPRPALPGRPPWPSLSGRARRRRLTCGVVWRSWAACRASGCAGADPGPAAPAVAYPGIRSCLLAQASDLAARNRSHLQAAATAGAGRV